MKKMTIYLLIVWMFFMAPACFWVKCVQAANFPEIKAEQLKNKMDAGEKLLLLNPLSKVEFDAEHIPGSVNIPLSNVLISEKLPKDRNQLIVTYCLGRKCIFSTDAANLLAKRGYTNIMVFRDGIPGWKNAGFSIASAASGGYAEIPIIEAVQLEKTIDDYLVVDIRPASAYEMGYLPYSRAMPMPYLSFLAVELPKNRRILVVDHSGLQSRKAAQWLTNNGFQDVSMLKDGITGYVQAGFSLEK